MHKRKNTKSKNKNDKPKEITKDENPKSEQEAIEQFELELCWCIQKLTLTLENNKKLTPRQYEDARKTLSKLVSKNAPLIQKRQLMRTTFGDYRAEMAKEEKQFAKNEFKFNFEQPKPNKDSKYFKSINKTNSEIATEKNEKKESNSFKFTPSDNSFRFEFVST